MTPTNLKLLEMIKNNDTIEDICEELHITKNQLKQRVESIKKNGFRVEKIHSFYGYDRLGINHATPCLTHPIVKTSDVSDSVLIGLVADTHFGNKDSNLEAIKRVYEYFNDQGIRFVFHLGDLVDGAYECDPKDIEYQIISTISQYPHDDKMRNFIVFGNHDANFVSKTGINLGDVLEYYRDDFVPLGFKNADVKIKDAKIRLNHISSNNNDSEYSLNIGGHVHKYLFFDNSGCPRIVCPTLSDICYDKHLPPAALILKLVFNGERLCDFVLYNYMVIDNHVIKTSEINYQYSKKR